jgi:uncharacterized phiE125 gp8 family phage protein
MRSIVQTVAPIETPVCLDELKDRLKITNSEQDSLLLGYLNASVEYCQEYQWAQYCTATYVERFDRFPSVFMVQRNPLIAVTSLAYVDTSQQSQTLTVTTNYTVDAYSKPGRIVPAYNYTWPATHGHINNVTLTYTAGYGDAEDVPDEIKQAILLKAAQQYGDCEGSSVDAMDRAIHSLLDKRSFRTFY